MQGQGHKVRYVCRDLSTNTSIFIGLNITMYISLIHILTQSYFEGMYYSCNESMEDRSGVLSCTKICPFGPLVVSGYLGSTESGFLSGGPFFNYSGARI